MILMDILFTGSFKNALYGTSVKNTKINSSRTGEVVIAESAGNFKTCIRRFELSDGADMINIPGEARTGILEVTIIRTGFRCSSA